MSLVGALALLLILVAVLGVHRADAVLPSQGNVTSARQLDALLQDYAYRAFVQPRTGRVYPADLPANLSGIKVSVIRLRSGSLRRWGVRNFSEFTVPTGVVVSPYVTRLALVYQNLGNWSSVFYSLPGYTFVAPVIGILAYAAANLSATNLPELEINASSKPISIKFADRSLVSGGRMGRCVYFGLNGSYELEDLVAGNLCTTIRQGHFSIAVEASVEEHEKGKSNVWKIVVSVVAGVVGLALLLFLLLLLRRYKRKKKMKDMVHRSEAGEVFKAQRVGDARLPAASMVRTKPVLENEYAQ